jgi:hypothetical protein
MKYLFLVAVLLISGCCETQKYSIYSGDQYYTTNSIQKNEETGCITFKTRNGNPVEICGNYTIESRKIPKKTGEKRK